MRPPLRDFWLLLGFSAALCVAFLGIGMAFWAAGGTCG